MITKRKTVLAQAENLGAVPDGVASRMRVRDGENGRKRGFEWRKAMFGIWTRVILIGLGFF